MITRFGIAGRLFLAFVCIAGLSLASAAIGWWILHTVDRAQTSIVQRAMPAVADARQVAEFSSEIGARAPLLADADDQSARRVQAQALLRQAESMREVLDRIRSNGQDDDRLEALDRSAEELIAVFGEQNTLVARRIDRSAELAALVSDALAAAQGLSDLSETLVANASSGATAVISNLYELAERDDRAEEMLGAFDRLLETDLFLMERMFELRLRASQTGLLLNQLSRADSREEVVWIEAEFVRNLRILDRRTRGIADPVRRRQAVAMTARLSMMVEGAPTGFRMREELLELEASIDALSDRSRRLSDGLGATVLDLVAQAQRVADDAAAEAEDAVQAGLWTLVLQSVVFVFVAGLIIWLYVQRNVIRRLRDLAAIMGRLAAGDLTAQVTTGGTDELADMAATVRVFRDQAVVKTRLERERDKTEAELRRHKAELESIVAERTAQLSLTNEKLQNEVVQHDRARDQAVRANAAKTEFLAAMSHEIRTPMNGVLGMLRILGDSDLTPEQRARLAVVRSSSQTLLGILNDILDYSKIESGELEISQDSFDLRQLVDDIVVLMRFRAIERHDTLSVRVDEDVPQILRGDSGKISQVLLNLIGNGIKFTESGQVAVRISREGRDGDDTVPIRFEVTDTGIGIAPGKQDRLFEAFYQADDQVARTYGGTGLGLAISRRLVGAMGGVLRVQSDTGQGSRFWFTLPLEPGVEAELTRRGHDLPADLPAVAPMRILLVEDNDINALVAQAFLEKMGHRVVHAETGEEAVALATGSDFDVVLMDISLPDFDGMEAARRIRRERRGQAAGPPIIAMSAHVFRTEVASILEAGMSAFIGKPVSPERLADVLHEVARAAAPPPRVLDLSILRRDVAALGPEKAGRMVAVFQREFPAKLDLLEREVAGRNWAGAARVAHYLKGSALSLGLEQVARLAADIEAASDEHADTRADAAMAELLAHRDDTLSALHGAWQRLGDHRSSASTAKM